MIQAKMMFDDTNQENARRLALFYIPAQVLAGWFICGRGKPHQLQHDLPADAVFTQVAFNIPRNAFVVVVESSKFSLVNQGAGIPLLGELSAKVVEPQVELPPTPKPEEQKYGLRYPKLAELAKPPEQVVVVDLSKGSTPVPCYAWDMNGVNMVVWHKGRRESMYLGTFECKTPVRTLVAKRMVIIQTDWVRGNWNKSAEMHQLAINAGDLAIE